MATCSTTTLLSGVACLRCIPPGYVELVKLSLLCQILQYLNPMATCDAATLIEAAKCMTCIPPGYRPLVELQLMCDIKDAILNMGTVDCGLVDPTEAPIGCGIYYRTDNGGVWVWDGTVWQQIIQ